MKKCDVTPKCLNDLGASRANEVIGETAKTNVLLIEKNATYV